MYVPAFGSPEADLLAELNGRIVRIQVKALSGEDDSLSFDLRNSAKKKYTGLADWLALHSLRHGVTAFLKPEDGGTRLVLRYDGIKEPGRHYARDYPLERVIKELSE